MLTISVLNHSSIVTDAELPAALAAFETQVTRDFAPWWGVDARLVPGAVAGNPQLVILDDADQAGALGYHDLTMADQPIGKVFAKTTRDYGGDWHVTFSHELLEMLADPLINLTALDDEHDRLYALEVCDAVEDDTLGYEISGVRVSDFVLPHWFDVHAVHHHTQFSFKGHVHGPFVLAPGGYISVRDLRGSRGWTQLTALTTPASKPATAMQRHDQIARPGSRRERRIRGRSEFVRSTR